MGQQYHHPPHHHQLIEHDITSVVGIGIMQHNRVIDIVGVD
jgi:hypothetical protein